MVDISPLRSVASASLVKIVCDDILGPANKYFPSVGERTDYLDVAAFGWDEATTSAALLEDPIWRIPVHGMKFAFSDRQESKLFARAVASKLAGASNSDSGDFSESSSDDDDGETL